MATLTPKQFFLGYFIFQFCLLLFMLTQALEMQSLFLMGLAAFGLGLCVPIIVFWAVQQEATDG